MRAIFILLFVIQFVAIQAQKPKFESKSNWIVTKSIDALVGTSNENGPIQYLLLDYQDNVDTQESYVHVAYRILNDEGVQSYSNISVGFDPDFQSLTFHDLKIIRNGSVINHLNPNSFSTIQRESDMNRHIYDGSYTSYINLADVRKGDVVEYSFTTKGFNPVFNGGYSSSFVYDFGIEVEQVAVRIVSTKSLYFKTINGAELLKKNGNAHEINVKPNYILTDENTPSWFTSYRQIFVSTYPDWSSVSNWAMKYYNPSQSMVNKTGSAFFKEVVQQSDLELTIVDAIRFVQDEVRYLGFESGIRGFKPSDPKVVLERRFGDCKDKSYLLVNALQYLGVEAYPMLVSSYKERSLDNEQPSPTAFDHCVVNFIYEGTNYYVDPTISNQGGGLDDLQFPSYGRGLIIRENESSLTVLDRNNFRRQKVIETLDVEGIGVDAKVYLNVLSTYYGTSTDLIRSYFSSRSLSQIKQEYQNFFARSYPNIEHTEDVKFYDDERGASNIATMEENYLIKGFWKDDGDGGVVAETYALLLDSYLIRSASAIRTMPFYLGEPLEIEQEIRINLPEPWNVIPVKKKIEGEGFTYSSDISVNDRQILIKFLLQINEQFVPAEAAEATITQIDEIRNDLSFMLTYNESGISSGISFWAIFLSFLALGTGVFIALRIYNNYDPIPVMNHQDLAIGGWLILPAIGLILNPLILIYGLSDFSHLFNSMSWDSLSYQYDAYSVNWIKALISMEIFYNIFIIVFAILGGVLFFKRRSSAPLIVSSMYGTVLFFMVLDAIGISLFMKTIEPDTNSILKALLACVIWIPYLNMSERSKNTFVNQIGKRDQSIGA